MRRTHNPPVKRDAVGVEDHGVLAVLKRDVHDLVNADRVPFQTAPEQAKELAGIVAGGSLQDPVQHAGTDYELHRDE